jgi:hypothetical protein
MNIDVHIERLVLDGIPIPHAHRPVLQTAVEAELARLLAADGLAPALVRGGAMPYVSGSSIQLTGDGDQARQGQQIARALYGGIGK